MIHQLAEQRRVRYSWVALLPREHQSTHLVLAPPSVKRLPPVENLDGEGTAALAVEIGMFGARRSHRAVRRASARNKAHGMTTLPQGDLPKDAGILRTAAQHNQANVGVYADVIAGEATAEISNGDVKAAQWGARR